MAVLGKIPPTSHLAWMYGLTTYSTMRHCVWISVIRNLFTLKTRETLQRINVCSATNIHLVPLSSKELVRTVVQLESKATLIATSLQAHSGNRRFAKLATTVNRYTQH